MDFILAGLDSDGNLRVVNFFVHVSDTYIVESQAVAV